MFLGLDTNGRIHGFLSLSFVGSACSLSPYPNKFRRRRRYVTFLSCTSAAESGFRNTTASITYSIKSFQRHDTPGLRSPPRLLSPHERLAADPGEGWCEENMAR